VFKTVYVEMDGIDTNSGKTPDDPFETIAHAYSSLDAEGGIVYIGRGHYPVDSEIALTKPVRFIGRDKTETVVVSGISSGYVFRKSPGALVTGIEFEKIGFDMQDVSNAAGLYFENANSVVIKECGFYGAGIWSVVFGASGATADTTTIVCQGVQIEGCEFRGAVSTYEALLIFNTVDITVADCTFSEIGDTAIGLGFYQNVRNALVKNCDFSSTGTGGVGMYYAFSTNDIKVYGSRFRIGVPIQGALTSDHGNFGFAWVDGLHIEDCDIQGLADGRGVEIGACRSARLVTSHIHDSYGSGMWISRGHLAVGEGTHLSTGLRIIGCKIRNNNQVNTFNALHPAIFILNDTLDQDIDLQLVETVIEDDQLVATQTYAWYADPGITGYREILCSIEGLTTGHLNP
jgi:hypothetical protein